MSDTPGTRDAYASKKRFNEEERAAKEAWTMIGELVMEERITGNFPSELNMSFNDVWAEEYHV